MLTYVSNICCVAAIIVGVAAALALSVLVLAGSPNSTPYQQSRFRFMILTTLVVTLACVGGAIWSMISGKPWLGACVGLMPLAVSALLLAWASMIKL